MSLLEAAVEGPGAVLGIAVGWVGVRYVGPAVGGVLRPIAKTLIKGALVVNDGVGKIANPRPHARGRASGQDRDVTIAVGTKSKSAPPPRARRSRSRPASGSVRRTHARKAHARS
jgi:hypothetical protein